MKKILRKKKTQMIQKKSKKRKHDDKDHKEKKKARSAERQDALDHGGWWSVTEFKHITGFNIIPKFKKIMDLQP